MIKIHLPVRLDLYLNFGSAKAFLREINGEPSSSNFHYRKVAVCLDIVIPPGLGRCRVGGCVVVYSL